ESRREGSRLRSCPNRTSRAGADDVRPRSGQKPGAPTSWLPTYTIGAARTIDIAPGKPHPAAACVRPRDHARPSTWPRIANKAAPEPPATPYTHVTVESTLSTTAAPAAAPATTARQPHIQRSIGSSHTTTPAPPRI